MSCWLGWINGTSRISICRELRLTITSTRWDCSVILSLMWNAIIWRYSTCKPDPLLHTRTLASYYIYCIRNNWFCINGNAGWSLWASREERRAGFLASCTMFRDNWITGWADKHNLGHSVIHFTAGQHLLQLLWGVFNVTIICTVNACTVFPDICIPCVFDTSRASRLRWQGSLVRLKLAEWVTYYRCQLKACRLLLRTELQWVPSICWHWNICLHTGFQISSSDILSTSPYSFLATQHGCQKETLLSLSHLCAQETTYDRIYCPLSVECAIESRWGMARMFSKIHV